MEPDLVEEQPASAPTDDALSAASGPLEVMVLLGKTATPEALSQHLRRFDAAQLNAVVGGKTPLTMATVCGHAGWVRALAALGCDPNVALGGGLTALHLAVRLHLPEVVEALCEAGADPHVALGDAPSPLSTALSETDAACYAILAKHFVRAHEGADAPRAEFETLRAAIGRGSADFVDALLRDPVFVARVTDTAVAYCAREGSGAVMEVLLRHGGSRNALERGPQVISAVVLAAALGNDSALGALLRDTREPLDLEHLSLGLTPLMHAAKEGHLECVALLLSHGAAIDTPRPTSGWTALCFAANKARLSVLERLLAAGANPCVRTLDLATPLHLTTDNRTVARLLKAGADPNAVDRELRTPLYRPALVSDYMSVMQLIRYGANVRLANRYHLLKAHNDERLKEDPNCALLTEPPADDSLVDAAVDLVLWLPAHDRDGFLSSYREERDLGIGSRSRLDLMHDLVNRGPLWIPWTTSSHALFPRNVRAAVRYTLQCWRSRGSPLACLPRDVVLHLCSFVATPSADWRQLAQRQGDPDAWEWSKTFCERCWEHDVSAMIPAKHLTGSDFMFQPFYKCTTCKWGEQFGNNLGMCRACRDTCHKDHDTQISGFLPAFCDCGDSARCLLDSQWSLLSAEDELEASLDGNKDWRFLIAICHFHDPEVFREIRRPENLLHAVPGDLIKVERRRLNEPGLICEGSLHGEAGTFPASRSYVLPMKEFVRALEDAPTGLADALPFRRGDLILPCGAWDGNVPEGVPSGSLSKGKLIRPDGPPFVEGWFSDYSVDLVVNYDLFLVGDEPHKRNVKRELRALWDHGRELADHAEPSAIPLLEQFCLDLRAVLPAGRDAFRMGLLYDLALLERAQLHEMLKHYSQAVALWKEAIGSLEGLVQRVDSESARFLLLRARVLLIMSLVHNGQFDDAVRLFRVVVSNAEVARDKSMRASLLRLCAFTFLEVSSTPAAALPHCLRFMEAVEESGASPAHELSRIGKRLLAFAYLATGDLDNSVSTHVGLIRDLKDAERPLEEALEVLASAKLLYRVRQVQLAMRSLNLFRSLMEDNKRWFQVPEMLAALYECHQLLAECALVQYTAYRDTAATVLDLARRSLPEAGLARVRASIVTLGGLGVQVHLADAATFELLVNGSQLPARPAGTVCVRIPKTGREVACVPAPEGWTRVTLRLVADTVPTGELEVCVLAADTRDVTASVLVSLRANVSASASDDEEEERASNSQSAQADERHQEPSE